MAKSRADRAAEELEKTVAVARVLEQVGVNVRTGRKKVLKIPCPFHDHEDDSPTLTLDTGSNTWSCPSCTPDGAGVVELVARLEGVSRRHAIKILKDGTDVVGRALQSPQGGRGLGLVERTTVRDLDRDLDVQDDERLLDAVVAYYHRTLLSTPDALEYLQRRGLTADAVEHFEVGFSDRTLGLRIPHKNRKAGKEVRARLLRLGVLKDTGHERFRGCVAFPVRDERGVVVQIYGRRIGERLREGTVIHEWLHPDRRGVFNRSALAQPAVIVTKGIFDAVVLWSHGHPAVTCTWGLGLTREVHDLLMLGPVEKLIIGYDRTPEGDDAAVNLAHAVARDGREVLRLVLPMGSDVADVAREAADPLRVLDRLVRHAEWISGSRPPPSPARTDEAPASAPGDDLIFDAEDRHWRVRGLRKNQVVGNLRLNVLVRREDVGWHVDIFDLYSARHRANFTKLASLELCVSEAVLSKELGTVLLMAEQAQDRMLRRDEDAEPEVEPMSDIRREQALSLLRSPDLLSRTFGDLGALGLVGERENAAIIVLVAVSRLLPAPLGVVVMSSSSAGKSSLVNAALSLIPDEHRRELSALTGQALFYAAAGSLEHKLLVLTEEDGAGAASYALKLLISEGHLTIASTAQDPRTGRLSAREYRVDGPVALVTTTTRTDLDPELENRCLVLTVDESPAQTARIREAQRQAATAEVLELHERLHALRQLHQDAHRLLEPMRVVVPRGLDVTYEDRGRVRDRRDHAKLLTLVRAHTLLHQYQREVHVRVSGDHDVRFVEATTEDVCVAVRLFAHVRGSDIDDLPPHTARILEIVRTQGGDDGVTLGELGRLSAVGRTRTWVHLRRLRRLDHVRITKGPDGETRVHALPRSTSMVPDLGETEPVFAPRSPPGANARSTLSDSTDGRELGARSHLDLEGHPQGVAETRRTDTSTDEES